MIENRQSHRECESCHGIFPFTEFVGRSTSCYRCEIGMARKKFSEAEEARRTAILNRFIASQTKIEREANPNVEPK